MLFFVIINIFFVFFVFCFLTFYMLGSNIIGVIHVLCTAIAFMCSFFKCFICIHEFKQFV